MTKKIIGVFGAGNVSEADEAWQAALNVGRQLARKGCIVLTGGLGGVMTAASMGAREAGGITVGILPGTRSSSPANPYVDIPLYTGMGEARNVINVKSCSAAIAIGGEYGTLSEIALALKGGCPIILLNSWSFAPHGGPEKPGLLVAGSPEEAVDMAIAQAQGSK
ncbi:MAG: hypothetical protein AMJ60_02215 [Desulfobacterales bacterium SG8_35]|nr:MAG: hypothetical protein AMJ60_02215 [Desulfobacterales bacterium SG8_35]